MGNTNNKFWYAYTPAGTLCVETKGKTREECIKNLLRAAAHMPYGTWENFKKRGYTVEELEADL
jgi:hypothetical protein